MARREYVTKQQRPHLRERLITCYRTLVAIQHWTWACACDASWAARPLPWACLAGAAAAGGAEVTPQIRRRGAYSHLASATSPFHAPGGVVAGLVCRSKGEGGAVDRPSRLDVIPSRSAETRPSNSPLATMLRCCELPVATWSRRVTTSPSALCLSSYIPVVYV